MSLEKYLERLESAFCQQKSKCARFVDHFNSRLPQQCACGNEGFVPGLPCPDCSRIHDVSWLISRQGEWGAEAVTLNSRRVVARFDVEIIDE
jgi:hypothetical protein